MQTAQTRWVLTAVVASLACALDLASKAWARAALKEGVTEPFLPGILQFTLTTNTGGAFGIGRESKEVMTLLAVAVCVGIVFWLIRRERGAQPPGTVERIGFGLILGGALGNIINRFSLGRVTDFLEFAFISFPVFNLADALIDVGVALILLQAFFAPHEGKSKNA